MKRNFLPIFFLTVLSLQCIGQEPDLIGNLNLNAGAVWKRDIEGTTINVCWENPDGYAKQRTWAQYAIEDTWQTIANVTFTGWKQCNSASKGIRILINDETPHTVSLGSKLNGIPNGMVLNFTFKNWPVQGSTQKEAIKFNAVHEFGHALGIAHEQNNPDCQCGEPLQARETFRFVTPCTTNSVMSYCNAHWKNFDKISTFDKTGIQSVYGMRINGDEINTVKFTEELEQNQTFKNMVINFGGYNVVLHIDNESPMDSKVLDYESSGDYEYTIYSKSADAAGNIFTGYGHGQVHLEANKNYKTKIIEEYLGNNKYKLTLGK